MSGRLDLADGSDHESNNSCREEPTMVLRNIGPEEFETMIRIVKSYALRVMKSDIAEGSRCNALLFLLSGAKRQKKTIELRGLKKDDFRKIATIVDMWNCIRNPIGSGNLVPYDEECDRISAKLKKAYFETFLENVFPA